MRFHLFSTRTLVAALARSEVGPELQAYYLLASLLIYTLASYSGLISTAGPMWSIPSILEGVAVTAVTVFGVVQAFYAAGGQRSRTFLVDFTCLYVPVSVTTLLVIWGGYWIVRIAFGEALIALSASHSQFSLNLATLGTDFMGLLGFLCAVGVQVVTFYRLVRLQRDVESQRHGA